MAMSNHFLDTETRTDVPRTALVCVEAGLSVEEASDIWRYEVAAALWTNAWSVAGEWLPWPEDWLCRHIRELAGRWPNRPGLVPHLIYRCRVHFVHRDWRAIAKCMEILARERVPRRGRLAADLTRLAQRYFDFGTDDVSLNASRRVALQQLFLDPFLPIFEPLVIGQSESRTVCKNRVARWLEQVR